GTVTIVDLESHKPLREVRLGAKPEGVTFLGGTHRVAAAEYAEDRIVFVDATTGCGEGAVEVFDEPYGVVSNADGSRVSATLDYPGQIVEIDTDKRKVLRTIPAGKFTRGLALSPDGERLYVAEYYTAVVRVFDVASGR